MKTSPLAWEVRSSCSLDQVTHVIPMSRMSAQKTRDYKPGLLTFTGRAVQLSCSLGMPCILSPLSSIAFLMEDPTRSRAQPPSKVATTAVTMVTPPKVRSIDSRPTPNSSCPACVHARPTPFESSSRQQASRLWYQKHLTKAGRTFGNRHELQHALAGHCPVVPCQSESNSRCHWLIDGQFEVYTGQLLPALHRTCVSKSKLHMQSRSVHTTLLSFCQHLIATHAAHTAQGRLWIDHLGTKLHTPECQSKITWGLKQDHLGTKVEAPGDRSRSRRRKRLALDSSPDCCTGRLGGGTECKCRPTVS